MKRLIPAVITSSLVLVYLTTAVYAADVSGAIYSADIKVTNGSYTATDVSVPFVLDTDALIDGSFIDEDCSNTAIQTPTGTDIPYMPARSGTDDWIMYVGQVPQTSSQNYILYTGGDDMEGKIRYFPDEGGMTTADSASLELGNNFEIEQSGYVNTSPSDDVSEVEWTNLLNKDDSFAIRITDDEEITAGIISIEPVDITPAVTGSWQDVDVSDYIPPGITSNSYGGAIIKIDSEGKEVGLRQSATCVSIVEDAYYCFALVGLDVYQHFDAYVEDGTVSLYLVGFTGYNYTYTTGIDINVTTTGSWVDGTNYASGTTGVILEIVNTSATTDYAVGVRKDGSTDNRTQKIEKDSHFWVVIGTSADVYEVYIENTAVDIYYRAYITGSDTVFNTNGVDKSLGSTYTWQDIDCSTEAPDATHLIFEVVSASGQLYGFRINGDPDNNDYGYVMDHAWVIVGCDDNQICEAIIASTVVDFYLVGYIKAGDAPRFNPFSTSVTANSIDSGEMTIKVVADGTDLELFIDDVEKDSTPLAGDSVTNTSHDWVFLENGSMTYMEYHKITVSSVLKQHIIWENSATFSDQSGNSNDATPTFQTETTDPDVSAVLSNFSPIQESELESYSSGEAPDMITEVPDAPDMHEELNVSNLPGADLANELLDEGGIPRSLFWFPVIFGQAAVVGLLVFWFTKDALMMSFGSGAILVFFAAMGAVPLWSIVPYIAVVLAVLTSRKTVSL